ncbi:MAG: hypothetical protein IJD48_04005, partial [Clostridia bacterium]|nr:hypothetical protein [Clostridia bacterium]
IIEYNLFNADEIEDKCGIEYLNKLKKKTIKEIGTYENTLISVPYGLFVADKNYKYFEKYGTIVLLNYTKQAIEKYIETSTLTQKNLNEIKVMLLAFDETQKICAEASNTKIDLNKIDVLSNYKKIKKFLDKYYL